MEKTPTFLPPRDGGAILDGNCRAFDAAAVADVDFDDDVEDAR